MKTKENSKLRKSLDKDLIYKLYVVERKTLKEVAELVKVSPATLTRFNKENNIHLPEKRNLKDPNIIKELKKNILELQSQGILVTDICKKLHINHNVYNQILNPSIEFRKNDINDSFINFNNSDFCYILGFLIADGHHEYNRSYLCQCDASFLYKLQKIMGHKGNVRKVTTSKNPCYRLDITNKKFCSLLTNLNIPSNKKLTAPYIDCGINEKHFIRGIFDGDGCLYYSYVSGKLRERRVSITTGSPLVKNGIINFLNRNSISNTVLEEKRVNTYYTIFIDKIDDIIKFLDNIYEDKGESYLDRKYFSFVKFKKLVEIHRQVNDIVDGSRKLDDL